MAFAQSHAEGLKWTNMIRFAVVTGAAVMSVMMLCATAGATSAHPSSVPTPALRAYVAQVEKVRLPVNALLEGTDPIIEAFNDHRVTPAQPPSR